MVSGNDTEFVTVKNNLRLREKMIKLTTSVGADVGCGVDPIVGRGVGPGVGSAEGGGV